MAEDPKDMSGNPTGDVKTFTQEELNDTIAKRLSEEKERNQKRIDEAVAKALEDEREKQRVASLEGEEKTKALYEAQINKQNKEMERQAKVLEQVSHELAKSKAEAQLASLGLPITFASNLIGDNDEATTKNITEFNQAFTEAVAKAVNENVARGTPKVGTTSADNSPEWKDAIDKEFARKY